MSPESAGPDVPLADGLYRRLIWSGGRSSVLDKPTQLGHDHLDGLTRRADSLHRSLSRMRRFCVANGLDTLTTTTYAPAFIERAADRRCVLADGSEVLRRMRRKWGAAFPWVLVAEAQERRSEEIGIEVFNTMILTPSLPRPVFDHTIESWRFGGGGGYNGVSITPPPAGGGGARSLAGYASKRLAGYSAKGLPAVASGEQAYRVAQGFQPVRVEVDLESPHNSAIEAAHAWSRSQVFDLEAVFDLREAGRPADAVWLSWSPVAA
jgi:hypothetical protein